MAPNRVNRLVWLVDTIRTYGRITRGDIDRLWRRSEFSNGEGLPVRTFHVYRQAAQDLFGIEILCDRSTYEYYILSGGAGEGVAGWLLNTALTHEALSGAGDVADRILVDDIPSAREFLLPSIEALRARIRISIDYQPYQRSKITAGIVLEPYCLKLFRQRWYLTGRVVSENRTYALDRMKALKLLTEAFDSNSAFDPVDYFRHAFGIVVGAGEVKKIVLRVDSRQAKYFRALPLHASQEEFVHDRYSIFHYQLRISDDFVAELLSYGPTVSVLEPPELRAIMKDRLSQALEAYK